LASLTSAQQVRGRYPPLSRLAGAALQWSGRKVLQITLRVAIIQLAKRLSTWSLTTSGSWLAIAQDTGLPVYNASGGGTGSGLGCLMFERLSVGCGRKSKISFTGWSCPQVAAAVVEPYNMVLCVHSLLEHTDVTLRHCTASVGAVWTLSAQHAQTSTASWPRLPRHSQLRCVSMVHSMSTLLSSAKSPDACLADELCAGHLGAVTVHSMLT
jgi:hypothetical protein